MLDQRSTVAQTETVVPSVMGEPSSDSVSDVTAIKHIKRLRVQDIIGYFPYTFKIYEFLGGKNV